MNREIPHPCSRCEYSRLQDIYFDGRWILWCTDGRDEYLGRANCPYIKDKFLYLEYPIPCNQCQHFHLEGSSTLVPACAADRSENWGKSICPYRRKDS